MKAKHHRSPARIWCVQSLRFYRSRHLVFFLTASLCAAILSGALGTGESLHKGMFRDLHARLGKVRSGVVRSRGLFPFSLAGRLPHSQSALLLRGEMLDSNGVVCEDKVNIIGVCPFGSNAVSSAGTVSLNNRANEIISSLKGGAWSYRYEIPSYFSVEMPLGISDGEKTGRTFVSEVVPAEEQLLTVNFDPSPASVLPVNILVPHENLVVSAGIEESANVILSSLSPSELASALKNELTASDIGLKVVALDENTSLIKSREIFIPEAVCQAVSDSGLKSNWSLYHLADKFQSGDNTNSSPYGFVAAVTPDGSILPEDLGKDEVVINRWLADKLDLTVGDDITLSWRRFESRGDLVADKRVFKVRQVISMEAARQARDLMPDFPGLEDVDSCADWDVGMPLDEEQLNDKANEEYWKQYRQTPKAFISYDSGKECFGTVFGEAMSIRVCADSSSVDNIVKGVSPEKLGFAVRNLLDEGLEAAKGSTDFRGLFIGMAFILMVSALLLAGLSLSLSLDARAEEPALFSALGLKHSVVLKILVREWGPSLLSGAVVGAVGGTVLSRGLIWGLSRFWRDAFAGADLSFQFSSGPVLISILLTLFFLFLILNFKISRYIRIAPVNILKGLGSISIYRRSLMVVFIERILGPLCAVGAILIMWGCCTESDQINTAFFGAGFLLMISLLLFILQVATSFMMRYNGRRAVVKSPFASGLIRALQSGGRGSTLVLMIALGFFLSVGMLAMKHDPAAGSELSSSGSGGFMTIVKSASKKNRDAGIELAQRITGSKVVVPVRVKEGDEAGCMNMSAPQVPRLYGVPIAEMSALKAFESNNCRIWDLLHDFPDKNVIPALASDQAMLQYSLKMKADKYDGDEISYRGSDGRNWRIRIVGVLPVRISILQGALIVNEDHFVRMFPGEGFRMWLTDYAPYELRVNNSAELRYPEPGIQVETAVHRLRMLGKMESSYLDMFLVLGAFGLALGVIGVSLVIARSIEERRYEFALLQALGIRKQRMLQSVLAEYGSLTVTGIAAGLLPALIAVQPAAASLNSGINWSLVMVVVALLLLTAFISVTAGSLYALRGFNIAMLKREP